jgi:hypothetical protein
MLRADRERLGLGIQVPIPSARIGVRVRHGDNEDLVECSEGWPILTSRWQEPA